LELKILKPYLLYSNLIVSLAAGLLSAGFVKNISGSYSNSVFYYGIFSFSATLCTYNFHRILKVHVKQKTAWMNWIRNHKKYSTALSILAFILALYSLILLQVNNWWNIGILVGSSVLSVFYVVKVRGINLREIPHLKIHLIAIIWIAVTLLFPIINANLCNWENLYFAGIHYFYFIAVTIPFDIRDLKYDDTNQKTIPQLMGVSRSKMLAAFLIILFSVSSVLIHKELLLNGIFYVAILLQLYLIIGMDQQKGDLYCAGFIDGAIILLGLAYLIEQ
jgi:4-hydroxybenzoate polyprenyltransferase